MRSATRSSATTPVSRLYPILLTALMLAADRVDSTTGVQMAYLKRWAPRAYNDLQLRAPALLDGPGRAVLGEAAEVVDEVGEVDFAYLDPPYNQHSYRANYHVWETLIRWDDPPHYGVACKRADVRDPESKSPFNRRAEMPAALRRVIERVRARTLVVSYNDESWLAPEDIERWLAAGPYERVRVLAFDSKRYVGAQIGIHDPRGRKVGRVSHLRNVEYLFIAGPAAAVDAAVHAVRAVAPSVRPSGRPSVHGPDDAACARGSGPAAKSLYVLGGLRGRDHRIRAREVQRDMAGVGPAHEVGRSAVRGPDLKHFPVPRWGLHSPAAYHDAVPDPGARRPPTVPGPGQGRQRRPDSRRCRADGVDVALPLPGQPRNARSSLLGAAGRAVDLAVEAQGPFHHMPAADPAARRQLHLGAAQAIEPVYGSVADRDGHDVGAILAAYLTADHCWPPLRAAAQPRPVTGLRSAGRPVLGWRRSPVHLRRFAPARPAGRGQGPCRRAFVPAGTAPSPSQGIRRAARVARRYAIAVAGPRTRHHCERRRRISRSTSSCVMDW